MKKKWSKEKIAEALLEEYKNNNNLTLSSVEIEKNKNLPSRVTIYDFFGKPLNEVWKEIASEKKLKLNFRKKKPSKQKISKELIIKRIKSLSKKLNKVPTFDEYKKNFGFNQISNKFNGYSELVEKANLGHNWRGNMSREKMISYLQENIDNGKIKSTRDLRLKKEFPELHTVFRILNCNSPEEINKIIKRDVFYKKIKKSNYKSIKGKSSEELLKEYISLSKNLVRENGATGNDIEDYLSYSSKSFIARFKSLEELRRRAGYKYQEKYSYWNKEKIRKALLTEYKNNNNRTLKIREIELNENLPSSSTIKKYFKKNFKEIWEEI